MSEWLALMKIYRTKVPTYRSSSFHSLERRHPAVFVSGSGEKALAATCGKQHELQGQRNEMK